MYVAVDDSLFWCCVDERNLRYVAGNQTYFNATAKGYNSSTTVQIQIANAISPLLEYSWSTDEGDWRLPFATAIVQVEDGLISSIKWDEGCFACEPEACYNNQCGIDRQLCFEGGQDC